MRPFSLVALCVLVTPLLGQQKAPEDALPASCFGYVRFAGLAACTKAAGSLGLVQLGKGVLERGGDALKDKALVFGGHDATAVVRGKLDELGIDRSALRDLLSAPLALGFGRPVLFDVAAMPGLALVVDVTGREAQAEKIVDAFGRALRGKTKKSLAITRDEKKVRGVDTIVLHPEKVNGEVAFARLGGLLIVTNSEPMLADCLATAQGERPGLAHPRAPEGALLSAYLSLAALTNVLAPVLPYEVDPVFAAIGITGCDSLSASLTAKGALGTDLLRIGARCPADGLLRSVLGGAPSSGAAVWCPDDTGLFASLSLDMKALSAGIARVRDSLPRGARHELDRHHVAHVQETLDALGVIGPELAIAVTMPAAKSIVPQIVISARVRDEERAVQTLLGLAQQMHGPEWQETQFRGTTLHYTKAQIGGAALAPAFACKDGWLIACEQLLTLKGVLARGQRADNPVAQALGQRRAETVTVLARLNAASQVYWDMMVGAAAQVPHLDPDLLPSKEDVARFVGDLSASVRIGDDGITLEKTHPGSFAEIVAAVGAALDQMLGDGPKKARVF